MLVAAGEDIGDGFQDLNTVQVRQPIPAPPPSLKPPPTVAPRKWPSHVPMPIPRGHRSASLASWSPTSTAPTSSSSTASLRKCARFIPCHALTITVTQTRTTSSSAARRSAPAPSGCTSQSSSRRSSPPRVCRSSPCDTTSTRCATACPPMAVAALDSSESSSSTSAWITCAKPPCSRATRAGAPRSRVGGRPLPVSLARSVRGVGSRPAERSSCTDTSSLRRASACTASMKARGGTERSTASCVNREALGRVAWRKPARQHYFLCSCSRIVNQPATVSAFASPPLKPWSLDLKGHWTAQSDAFNASNASNAGHGEGALVCKSHTKLSRVLEMNQVSETESCTTCYQAEDAQSELLKRLRITPSHASVPVQRGRRQVGRKQRPAATSVTEGLLGRATICFRSFGALDMS